MGLAGAGYGAAQSLEEILTRAFAQKQQEEQARMQQDAAARQSQQFAAQMGAREREFNYGRERDQVEDARRAKADQAATSERTNAQGVRTLMGDFLTRRQPGKPLEDTERASLEAMAVTDNIQLPDSLMAKPQKRVITTLGPRGGPVQKLVGDEELEQGVPVYQEPKAGPAPEFITLASPDGTQTRRVSDGPSADALMRQGWKPYDATAARQTPADQPSKYSVETARRTIAAIDDVLPKIGVTTAGPLGAVLSRVPGTTAANVSAELKTVAGNIAFNALQQMRDASKTGGALGGIAQQELELLKSVEGAMQQDQSPANLRAQLQKIRDSQARFLAAAGMGEAVSMGRTGAPTPAGGGFKILSVEEAP
jgi:hypothetical protein